MIVASRYRCGKPILITTEEKNMKANNCIYLQILSCKFIFLFFNSISETISGNVNKTILTNSRYVYFPVYFFNRANFVLKIFNQGKFSSVEICKYHLKF